MITSAPTSGSNANINTGTQAGLGKDRDGRWAACSACSWTRPGSVVRLELPLPAGALDVPPFGPLAGATFAGALVADERGVTRPPPLDAFGLFDMGSGRELATVGSRWGRSGAAHYLGPPMAPRILVIDNYDSFVYNLDCPVSG